VKRIKKEGIRFFCREVGKKEAQKTSATKIIPAFVSSSFEKTQVLWKKLLFLVGCNMDFCASRVIHKELRVVSLLQQNKNWASAPEKQRLSEKLSRQCNCEFFSPTGRCH